MKSNKIQINSKSEFFPKYSKLLLVVIFLSSLIINLSFLGYDIPITNDSLDYLVHAKEISNQGKLPIGNYPSNDGWPILVSIFLNFSNSESFLNDSNLQKIIATILVSTTLIPIYLLCKKFVRNEIAMISGSLYIFHPLIIKNSFQGLTESFFILLIAFMLLCMISKNNKLSMLGIFLISIASVVRYEAIILVIPFTISYFLKNKFTKKTVLVFLVGLLIFVSIILPVSMMRIEAIGNDGIFSNINGSGVYFSNHIIQGIPEDDIIPGEDYSNKSLNFISRSAEIFVISIGLTMIPFFIFVIPTGVYFFFKNRNVNTWVLVIFAIALSLPVAYAFGRGISEPRYLFVLFPIFCVISSFTLQKIQDVTKSKVIIFIILSCVIFSTSLLVNESRENIMFEKNAFENAVIITSVANGINYYSQSKYIEAADLSDGWPDTPEFDKGRAPGTKTNKFLTSEYDSLEKFIQETRGYDYENQRNGLTHLIIDKHTEDKILRNITNNESKYDYLEKIELNLKNDIQELIIYKINFEKFDDVISKKQ